MVGNTSRLVDFSGNLGHININSYSKEIRRKGALQRCEERIIFEKISVVQNETIRILLKDPEVYKYFTDKVSVALDQGRMFDIVYFDANSFGSDTHEEIIQTYSDFMEVCEVSSSYDEIESIVTLMHFTNEFYEDLIEELPKNGYNKIFLDHVDDLIVSYRNKIIEHNIALVIKCAIELSKGPTFLTANDLIQDGMIGLRKAIEKFNPYLGAKFSTMAVNWIVAEINRSIENKDMLISVPCNISSAYRKTTKKFNSLIQQKKEVININTLIDELGDDSIMYVEVHHIDINSKAKHSLSSHPGSMSLVETLPDTKNPEISVELEQEQLRRNIKKVINRLPEKERFIIESLFGMSETEHVYNNFEIMHKLNVKTYEYNKMKQRAYRLLKEEIEQSTKFNKWQSVLENY